MKTRTIVTTLAAFGYASTAPAQVAPTLLPAEAPATAAEVGVLPSQKEQMVQKYLVDSEERNPFATRTKGSAGKIAVDTQSEESRIRSVLESLSVSGISKGGSGYKAQLGSIILSEGELIPRLIPGQADDLRVTRITPKLVEITWVADEEALSPRQISLPVDLEPKVAVMLPTASSASGAAGGQLVYLEGADEGADDPE